jgi:hypothetical protein
MYRFKNMESLKKRSKNFDTEFITGIRISASQLKQAWAPAAVTGDGGGGVLVGVQSVTRR